MFGQKTGTWEIATIRGHEVLANFRGNKECAKIDWVMNVDGQVMHCEALVPHGLNELNWNSAVSQKHKDAAISTLVDFVRKAYAGVPQFAWRHFQPGDTKHWASPTNIRAYYHWPISGNIRPISELNLFEDYLQRCSFADILSKKTPEYFSKSDRKKFEDIAEKYIKDNRAYIGSKAKEFAGWWVLQSGLLGDRRLPDDPLHAYDLCRELHLPSFDADTFRSAVFQYAMDCFKAGEIPWLDTDYAPGYELSKLLAEAGLSHLEPQMPYKTWLHLDFRDRPPIQ